MRRSILAIVAVSGLAALAIPAASAAPYQVERAAVSRAHRVVTKADGYDWHHRHWRHHRWEHGHWHYYN